MVEKSYMFILFSVQIWLIYIVDLLMRSEGNLLNDVRRIGLVIGLTFGSAISLALFFMVYVLHHAISGVTLNFSPNMKLNMIYWVVWFVCLYPCGIFLGKWTMRNFQRKA